MADRFLLEKKIENGHYLLKVKNISRTLAERRAGEPDYRQEIAIYDQSKKPPVMIMAWSGTTVMRALLTPTGKAIVSEKILRRKVDTTSGIEAMNRDAAITRKHAEEIWAAGGPCPDCGQVFQDGMAGSKPCQFCAMPTAPAIVPVPVVAPPPPEPVDPVYDFSAMSLESLKAFAADMPGFVPDGRWSEETLVKNLEEALAARAAQGKPPAAET